MPPVDPVTDAAFFGLLFLQEMLMHKVLSSVIMLLLDVSLVLSQIISGPKIQSVMLPLLRQVRIHYIVLVKLFYYLRHKYSDQKNNKIYQIMQDSQSILNYLEMTCNRSLLAQSVLKWR